MFPSRSWRPGLLAVLCVGSVTTGCGAYYNTFYLARKHYNEAEKQFESSGLEHPGPPAMALYLQSIQKSEKVVKQYPDSKWVDDARYLIGMSRLGRQEYEKARTSFQRVLDFHPDSKLIPDCRLGIGMSYLGLGDVGEAERVLTELLRDKPGFERADEVLLQLAHAAARRRQHRRAQASFDRVLALEPSRRVTTEATRGRADALYALGVYDSAAADYRVTADLAKEPEARYELALLEGRCLEELGRYQEAEALYLDLERRMPTARHMPRTLVARGRVIGAAGRHAEAIRIYEQIIEKYPASTYSAQAQFEVGFLYEHQLEDLELARDAYSKVKERASRSEFSVLAAERLRDLDLYGEYRQQATAGAEDEQAEGAYKLAELKLLRLKRPDEALAEFRDIETRFPDTRFAPKAAYAAAWILEHALEDTTAALSAYDRIHALYPQTEYGVHAGVRAGVVDPDSLNILVGRIQGRRARADSLAAVRSLVITPADTTGVSPDSLLVFGGSDSPDTLAADSLAATVAGGPVEVAADSVAVAQAAADSAASAAETRLRLLMERGFAYRDSVLAAQRARADTAAARRSR